MKNSEFQPVLFMVGSMALFSLEDFFIKLLSSTMPASQIMVIMGVIGAIIFLIFAIITKQPVLSRELLNKHVITRTFADLFGALFFVGAIVLTPLSSASAILQGTPLAITAGAAIFLGEPVGIRRWLAVIIGFFGILLIVKPGLADFNPFKLASCCGRYLPICKRSSNPSNENNFTNPNNLHLRFRSNGRGRSIGYSILW